VVERLAINAHDAQWAHHARGDGRSKWLRSRVGPTRRVAGVSGDWVWDETVFAGAACHYEQGRLPYPPGLAEAMRTALDLDGTGRLLDVGCGPGTVALRVAHLFAEVVGLDPDAGMIAEAKRLATERGAANASFVQRRAEELPAGLGTFTVATFAQSFHWMDRPQVARTLRSMLVPRGAFVHVDSLQRLTPDHDPSMPHPAPPKDAIDSLVRRYLGPERRAGQSVRTSSPGDEDDVLRAAGYAGPTLVHIPDGRVLARSIDDVVAGTLSMSSSAPHLFGDRLDAFESDLRQVLSDASPAGLFSERVPDTDLRIWRPA
jgi:2-polyprenyl-3-methyl-5-hydroxy-6-metoxy-1,4-benzoquinol methylase